jgi:hypothetical protein
MHTAAKINHFRMFLLHPIQRKCNRLRNRLFFQNLAYQGRDKDSHRIFHNLEICFYTDNMRNNAFKESAESFRVTSSQNYNLYFVLLELILPEMDPCLLSHGVAHSRHFNIWFIFKI